MNTKATPVEFATEMVTMASARVRTCEIYTNRRALVSHNWVIVSNQWNQRGVWIAENNGERNLAVGPFPKGMPTCWTKRDAEHYAAAVAADKMGNEGEVFSVVSADVWWNTELNEARKTLELAREMLAKAEGARA